MEENTIFPTLGKLTASTGLMLLSNTAIAIPTSLAAVFYNLPDNSRDGLSGLFAIVVGYMSGLFGLANAIKFQVVNGAVSLFSDEKNVMQNKIIATVAANVACGLFILYASESDNFLTETFILTSGIALADAVNLGIHELFF